MQSTSDLLESIANLATPSSSNLETSAQRLKKMSDEKIELRIRRGIGQAIADFNLIEDGDRILVAISGGKDSWVLLHMLKEMQARAPIQFELLAINIDQGFSNFRQDLIEDHANDLNINNKMIEFDIAGILKEKIAREQVPCSLCARLRRGSLYGLAEKHGCNKIALGHHLDDFVETLLLNSFFVGTMASMSPKLKADDGKNIVIRPMMYVPENEIREYALRKNLPIVCCSCPLACGNNEKFDSKRKMVKQMITLLEAKIPDIRQSLLKSMSNVRPSHLFDQSLWDFS